MNKYLLLATLIFTSACSLLEKVESVRPKDKIFKVRWVKNIGPAYESGNLPISLGGVNEFEGITFAGGMNTFYAFNSDNGRHLWSAKIRKGHNSVPAIYKEKVIYGDMEGRIYSRDYATGKLAYSVDVGASIESGPHFYQGRALFHLRNHKLVVLDTISGKILWSYHRSVPFRTTLQRAGTPLVHQGRIYIGFADGNVAALQLEDGALLWEKKLSTSSKFIDVDNTPLVLGNRLYISSMAENLYALHPATGAVLKKYDFIPTRAPKFLGHKNKRLFIPTNDGSIVVMDEAGNVLNKKLLVKAPLTHITWWKNKLIVGTLAGAMYALNPGSLDIVEKFNFGPDFSGVSAPLIVSKKRLLALSARYRLYSFE